MNLNYLKIDTQSIDFDKDFSKYEESIFDILQNSYNDFYGKEYHKQRMINGKSIIYMAFDDETLVGFSYVKRNCRRCATCIFPYEYRRKGIAQQLIKLSFQDIPNQYSMLSTNLPHSHIMLNLILKIGFKKASSIEKIKEIVSEDFPLLSDFRNVNDYLVFNRKSSKRKKQRESLTLLYI